jgi:L-threonylcarbamoyladenylate synthase
MTMDMIDQAVRILHAGGLVAFPTDTVYGLGGDATNPDAVKRIFAAKGRPATNPLIVHVADQEIARQLAGDWPPQARDLAGRFWPGPLTLVVPKGDAIVADVTAGLATVGLRAPDHPMSLELLRRFAGGLAGPSANRSTRVSPTTAQHVKKELGDRVDLILDGGPCRVGIESTVLDLSGPRAIIRRLGGVSRQQIEGVIGAVDVFEGTVSSNQPAISPGQHAVHYAPVTTTFRFRPGQADIVARWCRAHAADAAVILIVGELADHDVIQRAVSEKHQVVQMPSGAELYARRLYAALHDADEQMASVIWIEEPSNDSCWAPVRDRLRRAAREYVE